MQLAGNSEVRTEKLRYGRVLNHCTLVKQVGYIVDVLVSCARMEEKRIKIRRYWRQGNDVMVQSSQKSKIDTSI